MKCDELRSGEPLRNGIIVLEVFKFKSVETP